MSESNLKNNQLNSDATSSYPNAMYDENIVCPKLETGFAFKPHMNDKFVNDFIYKTFNQDGNDSAFSKKSTTRLILYFNIYQLEKKLKT